MKLFARTHTPKAGARWRYRVVATDQRHRKLAGRITVQIVDPLGRAHPVQYGNTKRNITRMPFRARSRAIGSVIPATPAFDAL